MIYSFEITYVDVFEDLKSLAGVTNAANVDVYKDLKSYAAVSKGVRYKVCAIRGRPL